MDIASQLGDRGYRVPDYEPSRDPHRPSNRPHPVARVSMTRDRYLADNVGPSTSRDSDLARQNAALRARLMEMERAIGRYSCFFC